MEAEDTFLSRLPEEDPAKLAETNKMLFET